MKHKLYFTGLATQSLLYAVGGVFHFLLPKPYLAIMPPHYADPAAWVQWTGAAEIAGAVGLLVPQTRRAAAIGIILMLVAYFDVHIHMLQHAPDFAPIPKWALEARIPLQFILLAWAYVYANRPVPSK